MLNSELRKTREFKTFSCGYPCNIGKGVRCEGNSLWFTRVTCEDLEKYWAYKSSQHYWKYITCISVDLFFHLFVCFYLFFGEKERNYLFRSYTDLEL